MGNHEALQREVGTRVAGWLAAVESIPSRAFTAIAGGDDLPAQARADSYYWCDEVFSPEANPHDAPGARHGVHFATRSTPDLLRHEYTVQGLGLTVIEGRNFILVHVDPRSVGILALPRAARAAAIHRAASTIFRAPPGGAAPSFQVPRDIDEGVCFSTDDRAEPLLLAAWSERVEGGIRGRRLYFLCYKKMARRVGFASEEHWFDDASRGSPRAARRRRPRR